MRLELQGAERVGDPLDGIGLPVGPVVGRVDAPLVAGAVVVLATDPVHHRIAQVQVGRGHVDLRPQRARAVGELAFAHAAQEIEVLLGRAVAEGRGRSGRGQRAARSPHLVRALVVDEGLALAHELLRPLVEAGEVVGGVVLVPVPVEPEPADVRLDGVDVLLLFLGRVGVVHPQVATALVVAGDAEVQVDGLGMADVEVTVRLRREARDHFRMLPGGEILVDDLPDEVARTASLLDHRQASEWVAGAVGIEPTNGRVRACCLTVWRRPNRRSQWRRIRPMVRATVKRIRSGFQPRSATSRRRRSPSWNGRPSSEPDAETTRNPSPARIRRSSATV